MKKLVALALIMVMVLSFSAVALAANSPTIKTVDVADASEEGGKALEAAIYELAGDKLADGEVFVKLLLFSYSGKDKIAIKAADVKMNDKVVILFRDKDEKISVIDAKVVENGIVEFTAAGEGDYLLAKAVPEAEADPEKIITIPKTGDSNRLMKLVFVGMAAMLVMALAGVAIKRSNNI